MPLAWPIIAITRLLIGGSQPHKRGWATCPLTQIGFARLSMQPAVVKTPLLFEDVMDALSRMMGTLVTVSGRWNLD